MYDLRPWPNSALIQEGYISRDFATETIHYFSFLFFSFLFFSFLFFHLLYSEANIQILGTEIFGLCFWVGVKNVLCF